MEIKFTCPVCGEKVEVKTDVELQIIDNEGHPEIDHVGFNCPECDKSYSIHG